MNLQKYKDRAIIKKSKIQLENILKDLCEIEYEESTEGKMLRDTLYFLSNAKTLLDNMEEMKW